MELFKLLQKEELTEEVLDKEILNCLAKVDSLIDKTKDEWFLTPNSDDGKYGLSAHSYWTSSFYTGMLWLSYELTKDKKYLSLAKKHTLEVDERLKRGGVPANNHDLGFIYTLSALCDYNYTSDKIALDIFSRGADQLITRYIPEAKIIQAWGFMGDEGENNGRIIVDTYMNLPFLFQASEILNNDVYKKIALEHAYQSTKYLIRDDNKTYHTYHFDSKTGLPLRPSTHQGLHDESCWARGQAWAIYGLVLLYKYTNERHFLDKSQEVLAKFIELLSDDAVSFWDFEATDYKDSSAMAILICAILEMNRYLKDDKLVKMASILVNALVTDGYVSYDKNEDGILKHGCYHYHKKIGYDSFVAWGDYFYFEVLVRLKLREKFKGYW